MKQFLKMLLALVWATASVQALAWNMAGHMVTGAFVYQELSRAGNQAVLKRLGDILREHPDYDTRWAATLYRAKAEDEETHLLLMLAARWPDDARSDEDQHRAVWHYISFPFGAGPVPSTTYDPKSNPENLVQAFRLAADKVAGRIKVEPAERAIALCWLLHLAGDAHQPLHAVSMFSQKFPNGDKGGNKQYVRTEYNGRPLNLHALWDGLVIGERRMAAAQNEAVRLRAVYPGTVFSEKANLDPLSWTRDESFQLAKSHAYLDGKLRSVLESKQEMAPILPDGYLAKAKEVAERRISLAGYRLVEVLNQLLPSP